MQIQLCNSNHLCIVIFLICGINFSVIVCLLLGATIFTNTSITPPTSRENEVNVVNNTSYEYIGTLDLLGFYIHIKMYYLYASEIIFSNSETDSVRRISHLRRRLHRHISNNPQDQEYVYFTSPFWSIGTPEYGFSACQHNCFTKERCSVLHGNPGMTCYDKGVEGVCCEIMKPCVNFTEENSVTFTNPSYPKGETYSVNCEISMITKQTTCAIRIDFLETDLTPSLDSSCYEDTITILVNPSTGNYNTPFCGFLNGYSTLIEVSSISKVQILAVTQSVGALWKVQLTQIECEEIKLSDEACGIQRIQQFQRIPDISQENETKTRSQLKVNVNKKKVNGNILGSTTSLSHFLIGKKLTEKIFNGHEAVPHEFPWIALLLLDSSLRCTASLITSNWLITAGHCTELSSSETPPIKRLEILLGAHDISAREPNAVTKSLSKIVRHPSYHTVNYDVALLKLSESIKYSSTIQPICLPQTGIIFSPAQPVFAGWGMTESGLSPVLLKTSAPLVSRRACQAAWRDVSIANYMICSTSRACKGDNGGPLMVKDENEIFYVIGIDSFGPMCGDLTLPAVFIKVHTFLQWIAAVLSERTTLK